MENQEDQIIRLKNGFVMHTFWIDEGAKRFKDTLYLRAQDYDSLTSEEIEAMKQQRHQAWVAMLENPPVDEIPPTDEVN
jgi:hypothetical protein